MQALEAAAPNATSQADPISLLGWGFFVIAGIGLGLSVRAHAKTKKNYQAQEVRLASQTARLEEYDALRDELNTESSARQNLERHQVELETKLQERERALNEMRVRFENDFQAIASNMLNNTHEEFLKRANETFKKHEITANKTFEARHKEVDGLIQPMKESLVRYEQGLREMRDHHKKAQGELSGQIQTLARSAGDIQAEAAKLSTALKSGSKVRGRWGEEQLRNVVEMTGLSAYCDFSEQFSVQDGDSRKQPDMVINLPGDRVIAVDSKVSLSAYLDAAEEIDEAQKKIYLAKHAEEIATHVSNLAKKNYAEALRKSNSLDFVVMFIPGENFFAAALEAKPALFQDAFDKGVLMATPTTLIAILKSIAYGWRQEKASDNARKVADLAEDLYKSMQSMGNNLFDLGKRIKAVNKSFDKTIGNIERTVMPKARRFADYEMPGTDEALTLLEPINEEVREVQAGKDLQIDQEKREQSMLPYDQ